MQTLTAPPSQHLALPGSLAAPTLSSACLRPSVLQGCLLSLLEPPPILTMFWAILYGHNGKPHHPAGRQSDHRQPQEQR